VPSRLDAPHDDVDDVVDPVGTDHVEVVDEVAMILFRNVTEAGTARRGATSSRADPLRPTLDSNH
jgi:hypothetical protein